MRPSYNAGVTTSASTPRIRLTQIAFLLVILLVAVSGGRAFEGLAGLAAQATGFILVTVGTLYRVWSSAFIAGRKDIEIVREGPYARCRHPLYLGSFVAAVGLALSTRSLVLTLVLPLAVAVLLVIAIRREERYLAARHGTAWAEYAARVPAIWPRRHAGRATGRWEINLAIYRKAFVDAATVFGLWLLLITTDALRLQGVWGEAFRLP